jgi:hypothetical protein
MAFGLSIQKKIMAPIMPPWFGIWILVVGITVYAKGAETRRF